MLTEEQLCSILEDLQTVIDFLCELGGTIEEAKTAAESVRQALENAKSSALTSEQCERMERVLAKAQEYFATASA